MPEDQLIPPTNREETSIQQQSLLEEPLLSQPLSVNERDAADDPEQQLYDGLPHLETSIVIKSLYFLDALGSSTWGRFSAIYYNLHGLNSQHVGIIECLSTLVPTFSQVLWGVVADRCNSRKNIWLLTKSVSTLMLLTLATPLVYNSFWTILMVSIGAKLFVSGGILDAYTLDLLGRENKMFYGRYRLYASVSWGAGSIVIGWITDHFGSFEPNFILFGLLSFTMVALVAWKIPDAAVTTPTLEEEEEYDNEDSPVSESQHVSTDTDQHDSGGHIMELVHLALRPRVAMFLLEVIIMGAAMATVERLLFLYMVNDLEASTLLCGLSVGVNVLFELPIFWYAQTIMNALGHDGMYLLAMACFFLRVVGYTWLTPSTKWFILALEVLHGITFASFWVVTTDISKCLIHQTRGAFWRTAIPSLVQMLYSALGVSLGSVLGGWAMHRYGSRTMYRVTAAIVAITWVAHVIGSILSRLFCNGTSFLPDYTEDDDPYDSESESFLNGESFLNDDNDEQASTVLLPVQGGQTGNRQRAVDQ